ncbi:PIN domain-containing protein [Sphingomonas sp. SUN019]|uniref:type II toxin-antitoxin system VapC family toxin n=1 Tax=Sphingomonas sp. SUN019 TaxID=2937788 RepID=UPI0021649FA9|nr:PIN domain-containing protein [Sphingomonas sp. SUN019]UVO50368.1 PIN domain-containing protein [Sphingomonas sp. SUN019]
MTTYVDTSVLIDLLEANSEHHAWSLTQIEKARVSGPVIVSDAVYSEFSIALDTEEHADEALNQFSFVRCGYSNQVLFRAGKAYLRYRQSKGTKTNVLPDFFIGALADTERAPLLTRDPQKVRAYFPTVELITPQK